LTFEELWAEVEAVGSSGWEALSWHEGAVTADFERVERFTARPYRGDVVEIRTKMGRRLTVTADHPMVVGDGVNGRTEDRLAGDLTQSDWLPVVQGFPLVLDDEGFGHVLDATEHAGLTARDVIVRLDDLQRTIARQRDHALPAARRYDSRRSGTLRLNEMQALAIPTLRGRFGTTTNGTYVPDVIPFDEDFWRVIGLYLAEGHIGTDGRRTRIAWSFNKVGEDDLAEAVRGYWNSWGVKATVRRLTTTLQVSVSSRLLAAWFEHTLGLGRNCYTHEIPDQIWAAPECDKRALLRGLWDGDGSWSLVNQGPSVVLEYGTVSRALADGMVRLLGDLGIVARLKVGRTQKSTVDTYWLCISGADQVEDALWLFPDDEQAEISASIAKQVRRSAPTGYRRLDDKAVAWVRVTQAERRAYDGVVYSLEVPSTNTVVSSFGTISHNCFPKDSRALIRIAEDAGYDFDLLRGVVSVNEEQMHRIVQKVLDMVGGSVDGVKLAAWGLTFKARTDDLRESPALSIISRLVALGAVVRAFDPSTVPPIDARRAAMLEGIEVSPDPYAACDDAEVLLVLTEWDEFRWFDFDKVASAMATPRVVDGRNLLDRESLRRRGVAYQGGGGI
ncbi:MAG: UDPglucose 6-dehydrogenase, partial [Acidimicrobiaceae bacterium]